MALITFSGYPCSGKSFRASQLYTALQSKLQDSPFNAIHLISDHQLNINPSAYDSSASEKPARGSLFSHLQRKISTSDIVILDSLNYIKGFRYQIYCAARELKLRVCTIYVLSTPDICKERNLARPPDQQYSDATLDNLIARFEEPSSMVRWDSPLFTIPWDESLPVDDIWNAITHGNVRPPNAGTLAAAKAPTDSLHILEQTVAQIVSLLVSDQAMTSGGEVTLTLQSSHKVKIDMPPRMPTLAELQRLKRQFVNVHRKAITLGSTERGAVDWSEESVAERFAEYIHEQLG